MKMKNEGENPFFFHRRRFEDLKNGFRNIFVKYEDLKIDFEIIFEDVKHSKIFFRKSSKM